MSDLKITPLITASKPQPPVPDKNLKTAKEFEGMLMAHLFQSMRKTVEPSGLFGENDSAKRTYDYLFDQAVVNQAMDSGKGWGLAEKLAASWSGKNGSPSNGTKGS